MGAIQFFKDPRDRQFWMIGSAPDTNPAILVRDGHSRLKPFSIKFVFITAVEPLWGYLFQPLAQLFFNRYLKHGFLAMWFQEAKTIMSIPKPMSPAKSPHTGEQSFMLALAKNLGSLMEQEKAQLLNTAAVINSDIDDPALAKYQDEKMAELKAQAQRYSVMSAAVSDAIKAFGSGISQAARKN